MLVAAGSGVVTSCDGKPAVPPGPPPPLEVAVMAVQTRTIPESHEIEG